MAKETVTASWSPAHFDLNQLLTLSHQLLGFVVMKTDLFGFVS
ncbi:MAG TPA: hypothetical protein VH024_02135 [Candidatus Angelobacter sp.]|nr:hypothetical protein [Candidatus Angelobacter sp.]